MLTVLPLASPITPRDATAATVAGISARLRRSGVEHAIAEAGGAPADALLLVSGGTEHLALAACEGRPGPVILLAHPERNSLPSALEVLARLRQDGRAGRIVLVNEAASSAGELAALARHVELRDRLRSTRLGRIGTPSDWLVASAPTAGVVADTWGPRLIDVSLDEVAGELAAVEASAAEAVRREVVAGAAAVVEPSAADLDAAAAVVVALRRVVARHRLDACTVRCFDLVVGRGTTGCLALSSLLDDGIVAGCEGDVPATLTMLVLRVLSGEPPFMANPQDVDVAAGTIDLAHCTVARRLVSRYALRSHFESSLGVGIAGTIDRGPATVARIGGADLRDLFAADGEIVAAGDNPNRCRTQVTVRLDAPVGDLLLRPGGNHHVLALGHHAAALRAFHELFVAV